MGEMNRKTNRKVKKFILDLEKYAYRRKPRRLDRQIRKFVEIEDFDSALDAINYENYQEAKKTANRRRLARLYSLGAIALVLIVIVVYLYISQPPKVVRAVHSGVQLVIGTYTPTLSATPTPTPTPTPTLTPTPTFTPKPTFSPTPFQTSAYLKSTDAIYPPLPFLAEELWIIQEDQVVGAENWRSKTSQDGNNEKGELFLYTETNGKDELVWTMDQPFNFDGYYEIFFLDTKSFSGETSIGLYPFEVSIEDDGGPLQPIFGHPVISLEHYSHQVYDAWRSLGVYHFTRGDTLKVIKPAGGDVNYLAIDRLAVVRLNNEIVSHYQTLQDKTPKEGDKPSASNNIVMQIFDDSGVLTGLGPNAQTVSNPKAVNRQYYYIPGERTQPIEINFGFGVFPTGCYQVWAWIPGNNANAMVSYQLTTNGEILEDSLVDQGELASVFPDEWVSVTDFFFIEEESVLSVRMHIEDLEGIIGIDAVSILQFEGVCQGN